MKTNINGIIQTMDMLKIRRIRMKNGYPFGIRWMDNLIRIFDAGMTVSVTFEGMDNYGKTVYFTVTRDGVCTFD